MGSAPFMKRLIASVVVVLAILIAARSLVGQDPALARARALLAKVPLIDGHNDLPWTLRESFAADLSRVERSTQTSHGFARDWSQRSSGVSSSPRTSRTRRARSSNRSSSPAG